MKKIVFLMLLFAAQSVFAEWKLNNERSELNFVSTKNDAVAEIHHFKKLSGSLSDSGDARLSIALDSVETNVAIRNDRLKTMLFEVDQFANALVELKFLKNDLEHLKIGEIKPMKIKAVLSLHGVKQEIDAEIHIIKGINGSVNVYNVKPIIIQPSMFGLDKGIVKLLEVAKLKSIAMPVPVNFNLVFER